MSRAHKTIDIRKEFAFEVAGKAFAIFFIPNVVNRLYASYTEIGIEAVAIGQEYAKLWNSKLSVEDKRAKADDLNEKNARCGVPEFQGKMYDVVEAILEANDIKYERDFWDKRVSQEETMLFIEGAVTKDEDKKKAIKLMLPLLSTPKK